MLATPSSTVEEYYLLSRLAEHVGSANIDHRLRQRDFSDQDNDPLCPWIGCDIQDIETSDAILIVGSNLRKEAPIIAHRVRKAALAGSKVSFVNGQKYDYNFAVAGYLAGASLAEKLAGIAIAAAGNRELPASIVTFCKGVKATKEQRQMAAILAAAEKPLLMTGLIAARHRASAAVRVLAAAIAELTGARVGALSDGANSAGAHLAGVLPHRETGGKSRSKSGLHAGAMLAAPLDVVMLFGADPDNDIDSIENATEKLAASKFVAAFSPYRTDSLESAADLLLPIGTFAETSGTFVNCEARWQSFAGVANPVGEARPGWKVLRVLGNLLDASDFDYHSSVAVRDELLAKLGDFEPDNSYRGQDAIDDFHSADAADYGIDTPIYQVDAVVRRATALQLTPEARRRAGEQS